jgi:hypothetical protein
MKPWKYCSLTLVGPSGNQRSREHGVIGAGEQALTEPPPGLPEAVGFKLCRHGRLFQHDVVALRGFGGRDVSDGLQEPSVVELIDPFRRCVSRHKTAPKLRSTCRVHIMPLCERSPASLILATDRSSWVTE